MDVAHVCDRGHWRASGYCGSCHTGTTPVCPLCMHDLEQPGHQAHS